MTKRAPPTGSKKASTSSGLPKSPDISGSFQSLYLAEMLNCLWLGTTLLRALSETGKLPEQVQPASTELLQCYDRFLGAVDEYTGKKPN